MQILNRAALCATSSIIAFNSAFAADFFVGASFGTNLNQIRDKDGNMQKTLPGLKIGGLSFGLEGGVVFDFLDSFSFSTELFGTSNTTSFKSSSLNITERFTAGIKTRSIFKATQNLQLYGTLGFGASFGSETVNKIKKSATSLFVRLGLGFEYMATQNLAVFTAFDFDLPVTSYKFSKDDKNPIKNTRYGLSAGVRYYFQ